jgi:hypothetical protein
MEEHNPEQMIIETHDDLDMKIDADDYKAIETSLIPTTSISDTEKIPALYSETIELPASKRIKLDYASDSQSQPSIETAPNLGESSTANLGEPATKEHKVYLISRLVLNLTGFILIWLDLILI